jgi:hypothetical protein
MDAAIEEIAGALRTLESPDPFGPDIKASDEFLDKVFRKFFAKIGLPEGTMRKTDYHTLAPFLAQAAVPHEVNEKLDVIAEVAKAARPEG